MLFVLRSTKLQKDVYHEFWYNLYIVLYWFTL